MKMDLYELIGAVPNASTQDVSVFAILLSFYSFT